MKKYIFATFSALLLGFSSTVLAQDIPTLLKWEASFAIGGEQTSLNSTSHTNFGGQAAGTQVVYDQVALGVTPSVGVQLGFNLSKHFGIGTEAELRNEQLKIAWDAVRYDQSSGLNQTSTGQAKLEIAALRVPLYARLRIGKRFKWTLFAGPYMNFMIGYKVDGIDNGTTITAENIDGLPVLQDALDPDPTKMGAAAGVELKIPLFAQQFIMLRGRMGSDFVWENSVSSIGSSWVNLQLGYGIRF